MGIKVTYFKESGKYYAEQIVSIPDAKMTATQVVEWLKKNVTNCRGMHLVAMLNELPHGYPIMIPAGQRV